MRGLAKGRVAAALVAAALACVVLASPRGVAQDAKKKAIARGPFVSFDEAGAPTVDVLLSEELLAPGAPPVRVLYNVAGVSSAQVAELAVVEGARRRATLAGVPRGAKVDYQVRAGDASLGTFTLSSLPAAGSSHVSFCAIGDSGWPKRGGFEPREDQVALAKVMERESPDLVLHAGDLIYLAGQPEGLDPLVFNVYGGTLARVPFFLALGNHDVVTKDGAPTLGALPYPPNANGNRWYSFDAGPAHFVALDSNRIVYVEDKDTFLASPQAKWLKADLAQSTARWKVVWFHHPMYSGTAKRQRQIETMRRNLEPLLHEGGVDLVIVGHDHFYWRSHPVLGGQKSDKGMVHLVVGGGGAGLYDPESAAGDELTAKVSKAFSVARVDIDGDVASLKVLSPEKDGTAKLIDEARIPSRASAKKTFR